ncbi:MAG: phenylacetic acid degradation bifunctional protein PaaZ, partial [Pseudomonadota bacterium]
MGVIELNSFAEGRFHAPTDRPVDIASAVTGDVIARASSQGLDFRSMASYARDVGGPALRRLTFHDRALMLKALAQYLNERKEALYALSLQTGATRPDSMIDIDGGIGTLFVMSSKGRREMPNADLYVDGGPEVLARDGGFVGQHVYTARQGVAIHINAFNFPVWGMLEKLAPALIAGMPVIVKPATATAYLAEAAFRMMIESELLPAGSVQLIVGSTGDLLDHVTCQDVVSFTGSAETAEKLQVRPAIIANATRFIAERDSLNASILGPDADTASPEFDLFVREVAKEMTVKAGQKCTAIRRAIVPRDRLPAVADALAARLGSLQVGDPALESTRMGALAGQDQRRDVYDKVAHLEKECERLFGDPDAFDVVGADAKAGAFVPPMLFHCADPHRAVDVHAIEPFGPVSTLMP